MQVITSTGFGDSGSSAITDLLSEYKGIKSYGSEWECTFLHMPGGVGDLEAAVSEGHRLKTDYAINTFLQFSKKLSEQAEYKTVFKGQFYKLSLEFINDITVAVWNGMYEERIPSFQNSLSKKEKTYIKFARANYKISKSKNFDMYESDSWRPNFVPAATMYYASDLQKFYDSAKKYTKSLFELASDGAERLYLDQLLPPISTEKYLNYFSDDIKVFVVDKDPRDLFLVENIYNGSRFVPYEDVNQFISWYKSTRTKALQFKDSKIVYHCKLDDLVFDYENQCRKIEAFLGYTAEEHYNKLQKFNPEKSCVNLRLYEKYDNFAEETKVIEDELKDFLSATTTYSKGVDKNTVQKIHFENPIVNVMKECNDIQNGIIREKKIQLALFSTMIFINASGFSERKGLVKKIKGLIKIFTGLIILIPEFMINLIISSGKYKEI